MKKILSLCLCLSMVFSFFCFTYVEAIEEETTLIEKNSDCHELADNWFDNQKYDSQKYDFYNVLEYYFNFRQSDFKSENNDNSQIDINVSQSVYEDIKKRTKLVKNMQTSMNIAFLDADVKFAINDVNISNDNIILQVKEWTFYDYDNLVDEKVSRDTSGFGTDHIMTLCNNGDGYKIETDTYTESDMTGMIASSYKEPDYNGLEVETKNDFDDVISLCGYSYSANAAVSYADTYWENYNPNYSNYNSIGGDCANFVSQCLSAGGLQFDDNWYWYSYSNRSSSWAYCPSQRSYFSSLGNLIDNPSNSQVQKGNPVWYYKNGAWAHAAICVGTDSAGTPIVDAHNNNRYHVTWTLGGSSYWSGYSTVQLQDSTQSSGLGTPVDVGSDFYAEIMNKKSWLFLQNDNLNVNIQHRTGYPEQVWHFERQGDGSYKITSALDGKCLDVTSGSSASGANVGVYEDNGSDAQRWYIYGELDHYQLKAKCGNCVLDVKNGNFSIGENIQMWEYNGSDAQKFQIDKVAEPPVNLGDNFYAEIMNKKSWLFLQNDNLNVNIQHRTGYPEQVWHFERQGDGSYKITSALDGKCLDVNNMLPDAGTNVKVYEDNGTSAQRWYIYGPLDHYQLKAGCGNCVLDVKNGNFSIGENIQMWEYNGSDAQKFQIDKVAEPPVNLGDNFNALIINKKSWLHLENDNTNVIIRKGTGYLQQVWHFERQVDGGYKIISTLDGKCLDVNNMLPDAGTNVKVYEDNGTSAQRWYIYGPLDHYQLKAGCGNCVLDIENGNLSVGANVQMWDFNDTDAQKFHIWKVDKIAEDIGDNFVASIRSTESGLPLTVNDSNQVVLASSESSSKQLWKFSRLENGSYTIQSAYDGKLFSVESDEDSDKDLRILALNNVGGNNQYWKFYKNDQGYFLKPTSSSRFLGINDANFTEGNYLQIYNKSENDLNLKAQKFSVYKSDDVQLFAPTLKVAADGSNAKFTWNDVNGETGYNLTIYDSSSKANVKNNVSSGTSYSLSAGKYTAKVEAYNYFETKQSNTVEFEIKSGEIPTPLPTLKPTTPPQYSSTVTVGSVSCIPGGEVTVPVRIKNNPGISSFTFKLNYDKSKLTPVSITKMGGMPGSLTSNIQQSGIDLTKLDYVTAVWSNETDYSESGEMFSVKFKVSESVPTGEDIPIQISYTKGNIIDRNYNDVDVNLVDGAVNTAQVKYGDIYKDGEINNKDLVRLRQYLAEWNIQLTEDEYKAADVFRDGTVNNKDLVRLSQYLAEWDVRLGE